MNLYDVIIVGSGSTGGALAARLSEDSSRSVLVLEAGPVYTAKDQLPEEILSPATLTATFPGHPNNWGYPAQMRDGGPVVPYARGKGLGGSSSINGCYFIRGLREDFDTWQKLGNSEWGFDDVLPYYKRLERDLDFSGDAHGSTGPMPVHREGNDRLPLFTNAFEEGCVALGFGRDPDKNDPRAGAGVGPTPMNIDGGARVGTALAYLIPALGRPNLTILGGAMVTRVLFEGTRAVGVEALVDGRLVEYHGTETVIATGALRTPQVLMLSGLGPAAHLAEHGITTVADLAGVGQNLTDHPMVTATWSARIDLPRMMDRGVLTSVLHATVDGADIEILPFVANFPDMISPVGVPPEVQAEHLVHGASNSSLLGIIVLQEDSRGTVTLRSGDPSDMPVLNWNLMATDYDKHQLRTAVRTTHEIFQTSALRGIDAHIDEITDADLATDAALNEFMSTRIVGGHPTGTARMGQADDPAAVVDQHLRVHGVEGLRVADTSVFPAITTRGPNATAVMLGERLADLMA